MDESIPLSIDEWFNLYVYNWMYKDLRRAIDAGANYLAALGLSVYSEALMQFEFEGNGNSQLRFDKFLELLPDEYKKVDAKLKSLSSKDGLYNRVRCGLAHEYFVKKKATIYREPKGAIPCGIIYNEKNDELFIILETYFTDFKRGAEKLHQRLKDKSLVANRTGHSGLVITLGGTGDWFPSQVDSEDESFFIDGKLLKKG